jgi:hypothetical protein
MMVGVAALRGEALEDLTMRLALISALSFGVVGGCATVGMGHEGMMQGMTHEEMMRHCQMMEQAQQAQPAQQGDQQGATQGGMDHEEMMRRCAMMRQQQAPAIAAPETPPADPHQH